jgi:hypothetical protein
MDKKIAGLLGAVAALGTLGAAQATPAPAPSDTLTASSYADLLEPIPNAAKILQALDEQAPTAAAQGNVELAGWYHHHHHHHHHHHRRIIVVPAHPWWWYRHHRHHHHHHHHHHHFRRF